MATTGGPGPRAGRSSRGCWTWPAAPATSSASWRPPDCGPWAWTCRGGCWRQDTAGAPWPRPTAPPCRWPTASLDGVTCGYALRNFTELDAVFAELARVVRPGGRLSLLEVAEPEHRLSWPATVLVPHGGSDHRRAGVRRRLPTATCRGRPPTCRPWPSSARCWWRPGFRPSITGPCGEGSARSSPPPVPDSRDRTPPGPVPPSVSPSIRDRPSTPSPWPATGASSSMPPTGSGSAWGRTFPVPLPHGLDDDGDIGRVTETLATIACTDLCPVTTGAVVPPSGSLPFDRSAPPPWSSPRSPTAAMVTPSGSRWSPPLQPDFPRHRSDCDRGCGAQFPDPPPAVGGQPAAREPWVVHMDPHASDQSFLAMVETALAAIRDGELVKVVLARHMDVTVDRPIDVPGLLRRWHHLEPNCTVFSVPTPDGPFVGASPELLVERWGSTVHSRPLAGTAERTVGTRPAACCRPSSSSRARTGTSTAWWSRASPKRSVRCAASSMYPITPTWSGCTTWSTWVRRSGARWRSAGSPDALRSGGRPASHPGRGRGTDGRGPGHDPTSRTRAPRVVRRAGGYVEAGGDGCWMLGIRAMTVRGPRAPPTAGVGIVSGSHPSVELAETNAKLAAVIDALTADDRDPALGLLEQAPTVTS